MKKPLILACSAASALIFAAGLPNEIFNYGLPPLGFIALIPLYFGLGASPSFGFAALACGLYGGLHHALSSYWLFYFKDFALYTIGASTLAYCIVYAVLGLYLALFLRRTGSLRPLAFALVWTCFEYMKSTGFLGYPWGLLPYTQTEVLASLQIAEITGVYGISFVLAFANAVLAESLRGLGRPVLAPPLLAEARHLVASPPRGGARGGAEARPEKAAGRRPSLRSPAARLGAGILPAFSPNLLAGYGLFALGLYALLLGYGALSMAIPRPERGSFDALIVQQNVDPWYEGNDAAISANIRLSREALGRAGLAGRKTPPDLILFSESSIRMPYEENRPYLEQRPAADPLIPFIKETKTHFFFGSPIILSRKPLEATNSVLLVGPDSRVLDDYAKIQLVPFAEVIPFWEYEWFRNFMRTAVGLDSGWAMGKEFTVFELPTAAGGIRFGAPICFEDAFSGVCREFAKRDIDLLVNLTNDSWSKTVSAEVQHFAAARFRSIELRLPMIRSTNGGVSCVLGPYGEVRARLPLFTAASEIVSVPILEKRGPTFYQRFGDCFSFACLLLSAFWTLILIARMGKEGRTRP